MCLVFSFIHLNGWMDRWSRDLQPFNKKRKTLEFKSQPKHPQLTENTLPL